ncbi:MAG: flippase-like domain-containing protein [Dictyoglomi bacterium]|nr:flippase-like domain-containing protein [Dictyoglomota bacterium]
MKNKHLVRNIFIAIVLSLSAFIIVGDKDIFTALKLLHTIPAYIWLIGASLIVIKWFIEGLIFYILIREKGYKPKYLSLVKFTIASYLFHYITPFQSGGQAFQIYYLSLMEMPPGVATGVIVIRSLMFQIAIIMAIALGIPAINRVGHMRIGHFAWLAFGLVLLLILTYFLMASRKIWRSGPMKGLRNLIYKKYQKFYRKLAGELILFRKIWRTTKHSTLIIGAILSFIQMVLFISPLIVVLYYLEPTINVISTFELALISDIIGGLMPTPGGSGGVEGAMTIILTASGIAKTDALLAVGIWRLLAYYMPIGAGMIALLLSGIDNPEDFIGKKEHTQEEDQNSEM